MEGRNNCSGVEGVKGYHLLTSVQKLRNCLKNLSQLYNPWFGRRNLFCSQHHGEIETKNPIQD